MSIRQITVITDLRLLTRKERRPGIEDIRLAAYSRTRERERQTQRHRQTETDRQRESKERDIIIKRIHPRGTEARKYIETEKDTQKDGKTKRSRS